MILLDLLPGIYRSAILGIGPLGLDLHPDPGVLYWSHHWGGRNSSTHSPEEVADQVGVISQVLLIESKGFQTVEEWFIKCHECEEI